MQPSHHQFKVHSFDSDGFGILSTARLLGYLIEAATRSAETLGFGIEELQAEGFTWVLGRIQLVVNCPIGLGDEIEIDTWPSGIERAVAMRDFRINRTGQAVGQATSQWFVLDMETRLPVRPHRVLPEHLHSPTAHEVALSKTISPMTEPVTVQRQYDVRLADIDFNRHVTATSYIGWAMEALPDELWKNRRLAAMDVQFLEECLLGNTIRSESQLVGDGALLHRISRTGDNKELARLSTRWVSR
jgi:medium-chain acyl-[acyl-carrier-protein] hydrolase